MPDDVKKKVLNVDDNDAGRRKNNELFMDSEERYRIFMDAAADFAFLKDENCRYIMVNKAFSDFSGITTDEIIGMTDNEFMPGPLADACELSDIEVLEKRCVVTKREAYGERTFESRKFPVMLKNGKTGIGGFVRDVTESLVTEKKLYENEAKFRSVFNNSPVGMAILDKEISMLETNHALQRITGYTNEELCASDWQMRTHQDDYEITRIFLEEISKEEKEAYHIEKRYLTKDKKTVWVSITVSSVRDHDGNLIHYIGIFENITERKISEIELVKLRESVEQSPLSIVITDSKGDIEYVNPFFSSVTGYTREEVTGKNPRILKSGAQDDLFYTKMWETILSGRIWEGEFYNRKKDGTCFWEESLISPIKDKDGRITSFIAIKQDITKRKELDAVLQESEERFRGAFETSPYGMAIVSTKGKWLKVNKSLCDMTGYTDQELLDTDFQSITHIDDLYEDLALVGQLIEGKIHHYNIEKRYIKKDGQIIWVHLNVSLVRDSSGNPVHFVSQIQDITEHKKIEEAKRSEDLCNLMLLNLNTQKNTSVKKLSSSAINGAVALTESEFGFFASVDRDAGNLNILAWSDETFRKCSMDHTVSKFSIKNLGFLGAMLQSHIPVIINDFSTPGFVDRGFPEAHIGIKNFMAIPLTLMGEMVSVLAVANREGGYQSSDLTYLEKFHEGSWRVIQQRIDEEKIKDAKEEAERANAAKSEFLANMSHEIRTPMNTIIGMGHLLMQTRLSSRQQSQMRKIQSASETLLGIIDRILDFSKIEAGRIELESIPFDMADVLEKVVGMLAFRTEGKEVEILLDFPPDIPSLVFGDPLRLEQILLNIGANAVKFTHKGDVIFRVQKTAEDSNSVTIMFSVTDTGIGMSEEQTARLFKPFSQADTSTTRRFGGTGLGLAISKALVELMGGEIGVKSSPGRGSVFFFSVVFRKQQKAAGSKKISMPESMKNLGILIADDNSASCEILSSLMDSLSLKNQAVFSGEDALRAIREKEYDILLLDWKMSGMNGLETAKAIISDRNIAKKPLIIMTTAFGNRELIEEAKEAGISEFIVKPVTASVFMNVVMDLLGESCTTESDSKTETHNSEKNLQCLDGAKVLVVEDHDINREVAEGILSKAGIITELAENGKMAVEMVVDQKREYDCVLMDLQMPVMDGYEATGIIRKTLDADRLPVIAMTANALMEEREKCLAAGMNDYVTKPVDVKHLYEILSKTVAARRNAETFKQPENHFPAKINRISADALPGIDMDEALERFDGDIDFVRKLIASFADKYSESSEQIKKSIEAGDYDSASFITHGLKSAAGYISANESASLSRQIESASQNKNAAEAVILCEKLQQALDEVKIAAEIISLAGTGKPVRKSSGRDKSESELKSETESLDYIIQRLRISLEACEFSAKEIFMETEQKALDLQAGIDLENLGKAIDNLDFELALKILDEICQIQPDKKEFF